MELKQDCAAGRLLRIGTTPRPNTNASYGVSRLGLIPLANGGPSTDASRPPEETKKRTFKLPCNLAHRLKAYAAVTKDFQYVVVAHAVRQYLDRAARTLGFEQRSEMRELIQRYQGGQPQPGTRQLLQQAFGENPIGRRGSRTRGNRKVWDNICAPFRAVWAERN